MAWSHWAIDRGSRGGRRKISIAGVADLLFAGSGGFSGDFRDWLRMKNHSRKSPNRAIIATAFAETTTGRIAGFAGQKPPKNGEFNRAGRANAFARLARTTART